MTSSPDCPDVTQPCTIDWDEKVSHDVAEQWRTATQIEGKANILFLFVSGWKDGSHGYYPSKHYMNNIHDLILAPRSGDTFSRMGYFTECIRIPTSSPKPLPSSLVEFQTPT